MLSTPAPPPLKKTFKKVALCLVVGILVTAFGTPLQLLSGYLIGLEVTRDKWSNCGTSLLVPMGLRSIYYISAVGWLLLLPDSLGGALCLFMLTNLIVSGLMLMRVKQVEREMPGAYLRRVGYLTWGGYGVLDIADDDDDDGTGVQAGVHDEPPLTSSSSMRRRVDVDVEEGTQNNRGSSSSDGDGVEMRSTSSSSSSSAAAAVSDGGGGGQGSAKASRDSVIARLQAVKKAQTEKVLESAGGSGESGEVVANPLANGELEGDVDGMGHGFGEDEDDEIAVL